ncbi:MAG: COX15/CtaA family protein [Chloroflexi bacterium]|nr:COX15/CtaA family protein [Chloroflexota bacterium]
MTLLRGLTLSATLGTIFAAFMGSYVRGKGAGLACPDWPLCYGQLVPAFDEYIFLEWFHRTVVFALSLFVAGAAVVTWRRRNPLRYLALVTLGLLFVQAVMGGLTVLLKTHVLIVAIHQAFAFVFFACQTALTILAFQQAPAPRRVTVAGQPPPTSASISGTSA